MRERERERERQTDKRRKEKKEEGNGKQTKVQKGKGAKNGWGRGGVLREEKETRVDYIPTGRIKLTRASSIVSFVGVFREAGSLRSSLSLMSAAKTFARYLATARNCSRMPGNERKTTLRVIVVEWNNFARWKLVATDCAFRLVEK